MKKINIAYDVSEYHKKIQEKNIYLNQVRRVDYYKKKNNNKYPAGWSITRYNKAEKNRNDL